MLDGICKDILDALSAKLCKDTLCPFIAQAVVPVMVADCLFNGIFLTRRPVLFNAFYKLCIFPEYFSVLQYFVFLWFFDVNDLYF